jgi:SPX domain protein involved in polyphosphate accumulation
VSAADAAGGGGGSGRITAKFWVREQDVAAVMYTVLQHLPLLPSSSQAPSATASPAAVKPPAGTGSDITQQGSSSSRGRVRRRLDVGTATGQPSQPAASLEQQQQPHKDALHVSIQPMQQQVQQQQQRQQWRQQLSLSGFATTLHTVYFDSRALELYHGRLYLRPNTSTLKARWITSSHDSSSHDSGGDSGSTAAVAAGGEAPHEHSAAGADASWAPDKIVLERKVYREGWKGERGSRDWEVLVDSAFV